MASRGVLDSHPGLRIALIVPALLVGGSERHVVKLATVLRRRGIAVCVVVLQGALDRPLAAMLPPDVPVLIGPYHRRDPRLLRWLARQLAEQRADVAQSFLWYGDTMSAAACALYSSVPLIASERGDREVRWYGRARNLVDRLITFRVARRVCANSAHGAALLRRLGCPPDRIRVIVNGVDLDPAKAADSSSIRAEMRIPENAPVVGIVSRLVEYKGVDMLVRAFAALEATLGAHLLIVGDGPERTALEQLGRELGISDRVHFAGMRAQVEAIVREVDVAALTTRTSEHCSNSILEYMAAGRPVVATRVGGNGELIADGESGLLVAVEDIPGLAHALDRLLTDTAEATRMGREGRRRVEAMGTMERVADEFLRLCDEVVSSRASR
ncbi:MAG: glycosyltransferase [Gemmatimonadota bacterium]